MRKSGSLAALATRKQGTKRKAVQNFMEDSSSIPAVPGIYQIICTVTGKIYIGSSVNLRKRCRDHFVELRRNNHKNPKLQRAYSKYGEEFFVFIVIELVLIPEHLTAREQYWFKKLNPFGERGYNIAPTAGSNLGKKVSETTREKLRGKSPTPETRAKLSEALAGKPKSPETRIKMSNAQRGHPMSPETKLKLAKANKGKKQSEETKLKKANALKGRPCNPETREKIRVAKLGHTVDQATREKIRLANLGNTNALGHKCTPEAREKMRQAKRKQVQAKKFFFVHHLISTAKTVNKTGNERGASTFATSSVSPPINK